MAIIDALVKNREGALDGTGMDVGSSSQQTSPNTEAGRLSHMRSQSIALGQNHYVKLTNPAQDFFQRIRTMKVDGRGGRLSIPASSDGGPSTPSSRSDADGSSDEYEVMSRRSASQNSVLSPCSSSAMVNVALVPQIGTEESKNGLELSIVPHKEDLCQSSPPSVLVLAIIL